MIQPEDIFKKTDFVDSTYSYKLARVYISEKYKEILFVPMGKVNEGTYMETFEIIEDQWPCDFGEMEANLENMLNKYNPQMEKHDDFWPAYKVSKAKSQKAFTEHYILIRLESDYKNSYGEGEAERINVRAQASPLETSYYLIAQKHLIDTNLAQAVIDIFNACMKIRS